MQERETLYRALPLRMWIRALVVAVIVISAASSDLLSTKRVESPLWPLEYLDPFVSVVRGRYLLCHSACSNPYGIDDLRAYHATLGGRFEHFALWTLWKTYSHPLYRLDELRMRVCAGPFRFPISIVLEPLLRLEAVKGFPAGHTGCLLTAVVLQRAGFAFSMRKQLIGRTLESSTLITCSVKVDRFSIVVAGREMGGEPSLLDVEGELTLGGSVALRSGYRLHTDEIRCGMICRGKGILVSALWRHHPVLGRTVVLGVGCVWER